MNPRAVRLRMAATVLAGMAYGFLVACSLLSAMHSADLWNVFFPQIAPAFTIGTGILGVIYARNLERQLKAGESVFSYDLAFTFLGMILSFVLLPFELFDLPGTTIFFLPLALSIVRLTSIAIEELHRRNNPIEVSAPRP
jgi:hypothetical protein